MKYNYKQQGMVVFINYMYFEKLNVLKYLLVNTPIMTQYCLSYVDNIYCYLHDMWRVQKCLDYSEI